MRETKEGKLQELSHREVSKSLLKFHQGTTTEDAL